MGTKIIANIEFLLHPTEKKKIPLFIVNIVFMCLSLQFVIKPVTMKNRNIKCNENVSCYSKAIISSEVIY